jgi:hypothetical protein
MHLAPYPPAMRRPTDLAAPPRLLDPEAPMIRSRPVRRRTRWIRQRTPNRFLRHEDHLSPGALPESSHVPRGLR